MEAQAALVGADGAVVLHAVAAVDVHNALVVHPGDAELDHALRLDEALEQGGLLPLGVLVHDQLQGLKDLAHGLQELRLVSVALFHFGIDLFQIFIGKHMQQ